MCVFGYAASVVNGNARAGWSCFRVRLNDGSAVEARLAPAFSPFPSFRLSLVSTLKFCWDASARFSLCSSSRTPYNAVAISGDERERCFVNVVSPSRRWEVASYDKENILKFLDPT